MLTLRYINGFDRENNNTDAVEARFGTYVPTTGFSRRFTQAQSTPGYQGGRGWFVFNTAFWEANYHMLLGASFNSVVFHAHFKPGGGGYTQVLFLRFESGANAPGISLRIRTDGKLDVMTGGLGRNGSPGVGLATTTNTLPLDTWTEVEVRIDCSTGRVRVWIGNSLDVDLTGVAAGASIDRVTWRWEAFGFRGIACDHLAIATDDTVSSDRIGVAVINTLLPSADYQISPLWVPNSGTNHFSRIAEDTGITPSNDNTYLSTVGGGDDLYTFETPVCFGRILGLALNIDRKLVSGAPSVTPLLLHPDGAGVQTFGTPSALTSAYKYDQFLHQLDPVTADYWSDPTIVASAFGMRGGGAGVSRVTYMHIEKLVSLLDVPYECGEGGSYIL